MLKGLSKFLSKITGLLKRKPRVLAPVPKTPEELEKERIRRKYKLEFFETLNLYFVMYEFNGEWWYLRRWDDDYTLERARGNAVRLINPDNLQNTINLHQEWIKGGRIFLPFE